jgi:hypothetical protein
MELRMCYLKLFCRLAFQQFELVDLHLYRLVFGTALRLQLQTVIQRSFLCDKNLATYR